MLSDEELTLALDAGPAIILLVSGGSVTGRGAALFITGRRRSAAAAIIISGPGTGSTAPVARSIVSWSLPRRGAAVTVVITRRSAAAIIVPGAATVAISAQVSVGSRTRPPAAAKLTSQLYFVAFPKNQLKTR